MEIDPNGRDDLIEEETKKSSSSKQTDKSGKPVETKEPAASSEKNGEPSESSKEPSKETSASTSESNSEQTKRTEYTGDLAGEPDTNF